MQTDFSKLIDAIQKGDLVACKTSTSELKSSGTSKESIILDAIHPAMEMMDSKCTSEQFNLLELMLARRAVNAVIKELYPDGKDILSDKACIVLAALEGDVHDLGKNIVKTVLSASGYKVIDCGKDVSVETVLYNAEKESAIAICISGLITTVIPQVISIKRTLKERGLEAISVLAGGAALKQCSKEELNVDFVGGSAFDVLHFLKSRSEA